MVTDRHRYGQGLHRYRTFPDFAAGMRAFLKHSRVDKRIFISRARAAVAYRSTFLHRTSPPTSRDVVPFLRGACGWSTPASEEAERL
jgi:hypothetical protein